MTREELADALRKLLGRRQYAYQKTFQGPLADEVLRDLARFCRAHESTADPANPTAGLVAEGRREVWLRIQRHLNLSPTKLWNLYSAREYD